MPQQFCCTKEFNWLNTDEISCRRICGLAPLFVVDTANTVHDSSKAHRHLGFCLYLDLYPVDFYLDPCLKIYLDLCLKIYLDLCLDFYTDLCPEFYLGPYF